MPPRRKIRFLSNLAKKKIISKNESTVLRYASFVFILTMSYDDVEILTTFYNLIEYDFFVIDKYLSISLPKYHLDIENEFQVLTHLNESVTCLSFL